MKLLQYGPYSPSRLETATCGFQFFNTYVEPKPEARMEGLAQARGSAVHEVLEKISAHLRDTPDKVLGDTMVREWVSDGIKRHPYAYQEVHDVLDMAHKYVRHPWVSLTANSHIELRLAIKFKLDENGQIMTYKDKIGEQEVDRPILEECDYDDPEAAARGRADVLTISDDTTTAFILDHKTQPNVEDPDTFQLGFYAWVISKIYPFLEEVQTTLHFARYGKYSDSYVWTKEDLYRIEEQFLTKMQIIESRQSWDATPYKNCQYCPFIIKCPVMAQYINIDEASGSFTVKPDNIHVIGDTNKAVKAAGLMNVIDELSTQINKGLREYVKSVGPIAIPGKVFEYRASDKVDWSKVNKNEILRNDVCEVFKKHKIDPMYFMGFSETFTKSIWMLSNEALVKELAELLPRTVETKFAGYKV